MAEYIEKEKIINKCKEHRDFYISAWGSFKSMPADDKKVCDAYATCWSDVVNEPTADVQPVKRGKWLHDRKTQWKCSECGNFLDFDGLNCGRGSAFYCPNCGADMREVPDADAGEIANVIEFKKRMKR